MALLRIEPRVDRDEGCREHAFAKEVLQEIRNAKRSAKCVCGIGVAKVVGKDAIAHQPYEAAEQDTDSYENRMRLCRRAASWSAQAKIIGGARSPSVCLEADSYGLWTVTMAEKCR